MFKITKPLSPLRRAVGGAGRARG